MTSEEGERHLAEASGLGGLVYGRDLAEWEDRPFVLARVGLPADEEGYLAPLESFSRDKPWQHAPSKAP